MKAQPCVLERRIALACEVSVIVARNERGETCDVAGRGKSPSRRHPRRVDRSRARRRRRLPGRARDIADRVARALDYRGVLCVEMFVSRDGELLVNEIAPRPHNSGHFTIDACVTSQFEQQARVLADLPLGDTRQHTPAVMVNLLGDLWFDGPSRAARARVGRGAGPSGGQAAPLRQGASRGAAARWGTSRASARRWRRRSPRAREIKRALGIPGSEEI